MSCKKKGDAEKGEKNIHDLQRKMTLTDLKLQVHESQEICFISVNK